MLCATSQTFCFASANSRAWTGSLLCSTSNRPSQPGADVSATNPLCIFGAINNVLPFGSVPCRLRGACGRMASQPADSVPITSLPPQHLVRVRDQLANDVDELADSHGMLGRLAARSSSAARAVEALAESKTEQPLLLPLTSSLYVKGKVADTEKVLVNIGTDYYVEMSIEKATDYCRRKVLYLQKQQQAVQKVVQEKRNALAQVTAVLQEKVKSLQATPAGSSSAAS